MKKVGKMPEECQKKKTEDYSEDFSEDTLRHCEAEQSEAEAIHR